MRLLHLLLCTSAVLATTTFAHAQTSTDARPNTGVSVQAHNGDGPERVGARQHASPQTPYLLSTNRWSEMLLKDDAVVLQFTDYGLQQIGQAGDAPRKDEGLFGNMVATMALSGVRQLLDHSLALSLTDLRSATVRDGEVVLVTCQGKETFNNVKVNGQVQKFPRDQADDFVRKVRQARERVPACRK